MKMSGFVEGLGLTASWKAKLRIGDIPYKPPYNEAQ